MDKALGGPEGWEQRTQTPSQSWSQQEGAGEGARAAAQ